MQGENIYGTFMSLSFFSLSPSPLSAAFRQTFFALTYTFLLSMAALSSLTSAAPRIHLLPFTLFETVGFSFSLYSLTFLHSAFLPALRHTYFLHAPGFFSISILYSFFSFLCYTFAHLHTTSFSYYFTGQNRQDRDRRSGTVDLDHACLITCNSFATACASTTIPILSFSFLTLLLPTHCTFTCLFFCLLPPHLSPSHHTLTTHHLTTHISPPSHSRHDPPLTLPGGQDPQTDLGAGGGWKVEDLLLWFGR